MPSWVTTLHLTAVTLSVFGLLIRSYWMLSGSPLLQAKPVKILPHIIDTVLLVSGIALWSAMGFALAGWIITKWIGLIGYIVFGTIALKRGKTAKARWIGLIGALLCLGLILNAAISKQPLPFV